MSANQSEYRDFVRHRTTRSEPHHLLQGDGSDDSVAGDSQQSRQPLGSPCDQSERNFAWGSCLRVCALGAWPLHPLLGHPPRRAPRVDRYRCGVRSRPQASRRPPRLARMKSKIVSVPVQILRNPGRQANQPSTQHDAAHTRAVGGKSQTVDLALKEYKGQFRPHPGSVLSTVREWLDVRRRRGCAPAL